MDGNESNPRFEDALDKDNVATNVSWRIEVVVHESDFIPIYVRWVQP